MEPTAAAEHLQVIRTLMERSALYRRALAPITLAAGGLGTVAAVVGSLWRLEGPATFTGYWLGVSVVGGLMALLLVRRQALKAAEPFWTPPTRRVTQALIPPLFAGLAVGALEGFGRASGPWLPWWLPGLWMVFYGCALHAAGFFMVRGIKWFGWVYVLAGCALMLAGTWGGLRLPQQAAHWLMGAAFGGLHLAYGLYLYFTEQSRASA